MCVRHCSICFSSLVSCNPPELYWLAVSISILNEETEAQRAKAPGGLHGTQYQGHRSDVYTVLLTQYLEN